MSILSDAEIRALIDEQHLIEDCDQGQIFACSYEFRPGIIAPTGGSKAGETAKDWTGPDIDPKEIYAIGPGELVWVRTRERVAMPADLAAFWWQTNTLSRQGLMLMNMSMVEPGYRGSLACLFVNFGNKQVIIEPETIVAKLVFCRLGANADRIYSGERNDVRYDRGVYRAAMDAPSTFLDIANLQLGLESKRQEAMLSLNDELRLLKSELSGEADRLKRESESSRQESITSLNDEVRTLKAQLVEEADRMKRESQSNLESDSKTLVRRVLGAAAIGFVLVVAATAFVPWLQATIRPDLSTEIRKEINNTLNDRLKVSGNVDDVEQLRQRIQELEQRIGQR